METPLPCFQSSLLSTRSQSSSSRTGLENACVRHHSAGRTTGGVSEAWTRRRGERRRRTVIVQQQNADDVESSGFTMPSDLQVNQDAMVTDEEGRKKLWSEIHALESYLKRVVKTEKYKEAADLRDEIEALKLRDPYTALKRKLDSAVAGEQYLEAAKIRDELQKLTPPPGKDTYPPPNASRNSEKLSNGIRIAVESFLVEEYSKPEKNLFVFGYKVNITNESSRTVQLICRHWKLKTANGQETEVNGSGVVGRQPVLEPKGSFQYTSMWPIEKTENHSGKVMGSQRGTFEFVAGDTGKERFQAEIAEFFHILP